MWSKYRACHALHSMLCIASACLHTRLASMHVCSLRWMNGFLTHLPFAAAAPPAALQLLLEYEPAAALAFLQDTHAYDVRRCIALCR